jgi:hypothetical protein
MSQERNGTRAGRDTILLTKTTTPNPHHPPEIFDYIADLLRDNPEALRKCSRSAPPRFQMGSYKKAKSGEALTV